MEGWRVQFWVGVALLIVGFVGTVVVVVSGYPWVFLILGAVIGLGSGLIGRALKDPD
jgi:hypothetical protein